MDQNEEKKARELLDGENAGQEEENEQKTDQKPMKKMTSAEALRELTTGKLELMQPFRAHSQDITEIRFDFCGLTTEEMLDALDSVPVNNVFAINNAQALALFAATAAKCAPEIDEESGVRKTRLFDAKDVKKRLGPTDAVKAVQLAKLFYNASSQAGGNNISRE